MKILLPCPGCQRPLSPPRSASQFAQLRCSLCGYTLQADSILADDRQLAGAWEVVEDSGTGDAFAAFHGAELGEDASSALKDFHEFAESGDAVPQSNEWETQSSSNVLEEPLDTEAAYQISGVHPSTEVEGSGDSVDDELEAVPDEMIGVSDEPWFSPTEVEDPSDPGSLDDVEEPLLIDDADEFEDVDVAEEEVELAFEPKQESVEVRRRTPVVLPSELLGNSNLVLRGKKKSNPIGTFLSVIGGGLAAIPISILLMWYALGKDPLEVGPIVANFAPWLVPESFRGPRLSPVDSLAQTAPTVRLPSVEADADSRRMPPIDSLSLTEPATEPADDSVAKAESSNEFGFPSSIPEMTEPINSSIAADIPTAKIANDSEPLNLATVSEPLSEPAKENAGSIEAVSLDSAPIHESKIERSIIDLEKAIQVFDSTAVESGGLLFRSLEVFGEQLAVIPEDSPERTLWLSKGTQACQAIVASRDMLKSFMQFVTKSNGSTELFPGDAIQPQGQAVKVDVVQVAAVENQNAYASWTIGQRYQTSLESRPLIVPASLGVTAEPGERFLVIGVSEIDPESRRLVLRALLAMPIQ